MEFLVNEAIPCILYEDEHLLAINKPAGINTHAPGPFAGEGVYDWLRHREPRWAALSILHRLDKATSGVLLFGKTTAANQSLARQFAEGQTRKKYLLLTDRPVRDANRLIQSVLVRVGEKYVSRRADAAGQRAQTRFRIVRAAPGRTLVEAEPLTGRTHQIRVHAAGLGFPILGDRLYGGGPHPRLCLRAAELRVRHPVTGTMLRLTATTDFFDDVPLGLRRALLDESLTNAWRLVHGAADGWPGWYVERIGDYLLSRSPAPAPTVDQRAALERWRRELRLRGVGHKPLVPTGAGHPGRGAADRQPPPAQARPLDPIAAPFPVVGEILPERSLVRENGVQFELRLAAGQSTGLFLDQRDNRRRVLTNHVAAGFSLCTNGLKGATVLNAFAYTCGFSVCAALAGARTTSLDLSRNYLDWGRRNFLLNGLDAAAHEFVYGDALDWLRRWRKQRRVFDLVLLDPPTFSSSKRSGVFRAERDYGTLVATAVPLVKPTGVLFASTNAARLPAGMFLRTVANAITAAGHRITARHYTPQPPDFPVTRAEPAYLKTVWLRID